MQTLKILLLSKYQQHGIVKCQFLQQIASNFPKQNLTQNHKFF